MKEVLTEATRWNREMRSELLTNCLDFVGKKCGKTIIDFSDELGGNLVSGNLLSIFLGLFHSFLELLLF